MDYHKRRNVAKTSAVQKIEGLDALVNLEELWLGKNKISKLEVSRPSVNSG